MGPTSKGGRRGKGEEKKGMVGERKKGTGRRDGIGERGEIEWGVVGDT